MWPGPSSPLQADWSRLSLLLPTSFGLSFAWTGADKYWRNNPQTMRLNSTMDSCIVSKKLASFLAYFSLIHHVLFFQNTLLVSLVSKNIHSFSKYLLGSAKFRNFPVNNFQKKTSQQHLKKQRYWDVHGT